MDLQREALQRIKRRQQQGQERQISREEDDKLLEQRNRLQELNSRIARAKKILGHNCDEKQIEKSIRAMLYRQSRKEHAIEIVITPSNKLQREAVSKVARSLYNLNAALKNKNFPRYYLKYFEPDQKREELQRRFAKLASSPLKPPKRSSALQRYAVSLAADLLDRHNLPRSVTRGGTFWKLAAALYGKNSPDMFNHCRRYRNIGLNSED
jgi:hypothetical protein